MSASNRVVRVSKFRNVYGTAWKREQCYDNIKVSKSAWDSTFCSVNPKFAAIIVESAGGGAFIVIPLNDKAAHGRMRSDHPVVSGHRGPVLDIAWCPHNDNLIASGSEDCCAKLWYIPDEGLTSTLTEPLVSLVYHQRRVGLVLWHPTAQSVLLTSGADNLIVIWNVESGAPTVVIDCHPDLVYSACWNWDGSKLVTTCKDKKIRLIEPRNAIVEEEAVCHEGPKASRAIFLKNGLIFTTGFSKISERQYSLRALKHLHEPLVMAEVDTSNGIIFPLYDPDTNMIYLCGKGDSVIRYFEVTLETPFVHYINTFQTADPQRGIGMMPKRGCDVTSCEISRFYRLSSSGQCQIISMIVPRKSELFQGDLYPNTLSPFHALSAQEWFAGLNANPILMSMKTRDIITTEEEENGGLSVIENKDTGSSLEAIELSLSPIAKETTTANSCSSRSNETKIKDNGDSNYSTAICPIKKRHQLRKTISGPIDLKYLRKSEDILIQEILEMQHKGHSTPKPSSKINPKDVEKEKVSDEINQLKTLVFEQAEKIRILESQKLDDRLKHLESLRKNESSLAKDRISKLDDLDYEERLRKLEVFVVSGVTRCPVCHSSLVNQVGPNLMERRIILSPSKAMSSPLTNNPSYGLAELLPVPLSSVAESQTTQPDKIPSSGLFSTPMKVLSSIAHPIQTISSISSTLWSAISKKQPNSLETN